jgi:KipI family sensor histidine kinase inhibitor
MDDALDIAGAPEPQLALLGDCALLFSFGAAIEARVNDRVHRLAGLIRASGLPGILDVVPAYATLAVYFDPLVWAGAALGAELLRQARGAGAAPAPGRTVTIPVLYGGEAGPDLLELAGHCGLSPEQVVARHAAPDYRVYLLGFAPGFPYLGGLDPALAAPRRATPRLRVPRGSVGIAGLQTGVYPLETPGGWQLIGRTPLALFDPEAADPCLLHPGDRLRFQAIGPERYRELAEGRP